MFPAPVRRSGIHRGTGLRGREFKVKESDSVEVEGNRESLQWTNDFEETRMVQGVCDGPQKRDTGDTWSVIEGPGCHLCRDEWWVGTSRTPEGKSGPESSGLDR